MQKAEIGIIGGSGLYSMPGLKDIREESIETPYGAPSDSFILGNLEGRKVAFLARHGRGHKLLPSELNFRANIYAMKLLGVDRIISVSAVGSLKEEHKPTDFVIPDQFIDRTFLRTSTFFGNGVVGHVAFGDPICATVAEAATSACASIGVVGKRGGTYVCIEGPQFSTKAESNLYRSWDADVVGMTNLQEAKLAREAEICYATVAMVTDYDCWHPNHDSVTVDQIVAVLHQNAENAAKVVRATVAALPVERTCGCASAAKYAILTQPSAIPAEAKERLKLLFGKYMA
ncbi:S-methyl-5'-thioadenosine phosphorylase [Acidicapsa ligni]|uniref:S-methyl-5'-thioadenosine phosphorylase n=1 Tax=Acidicapsa ligni TaxID=542300 RepID=UPI0021DF86F3|nr:S-methyl-5'-thioadenosine phosphorylase [Acidicapsa ligni]